MTPQRFMVIAGEPSGDILAAELVRELRAGIARRFTYSPNVQPLNSDLAPQFFGAGGPRMAEAGVDLSFDLTRHAVTGLSDPLKKIFTFRRLFKQLLALAREREPHVIICVDFSLFNHLFAAAIKKQVRARRGTFNNWNPRLVKYISPQVWASRENRAYSIARDFDLLLSIIPFEPAWYAAKVPKLRVEFVGHPLIGRYFQSPNKKPKVESAATPLVLLLPGSRTGELNRHLPVILDAFRLMQAADANLRGQMVLSSETLARQARTFPLPPQVEIRVGGLAEALAEADVAIASTGTVTMECAYFGVPTVTLYKISWLTYQVGRRLARVKFMTMPNIIASREVFPEFIQHAATPQNLSRAALELLRNPSRRSQVRADLTQIIASLGEPGASRRAAEAILKLIP